MTRGGGLWAPLGGCDVGCLFAPSRSPCGGREPERLRGGCPARGRRDRDRDPVGACLGRLPDPLEHGVWRVKAPTSDVKGRAFDFGLVTGAKREGDVDVLVLDRWTDPKVEDAVVAKQGLPVTSWQVGSNRYVNQNAKKTFDIPARGRPLVRQG